MEEGLRSTVSSTNFVYCSGLHILLYFKDDKFMSPLHNIKLLNPQPDSLCLPIDNSATNP